MRRLASPSIPCNAAPSSCSTASSSRPCAAVWRRWWHALGPDELAESEVTGNLSKRAVQIDLCFWCAYEATVAPADFDVS